LNVPEQLGLVRGFIEQAEAVTPTVVAAVS
jgi:hypothetical protein